MSGCGMPSSRLQDYNGHLGVMTLTHTYGVVSGSQGRHQWLMGLVLVILPPTLLVYISDTVVSWGHCFLTKG